jgi:hypothetical protein
MRFGFKFLSGLFTSEVFFSFLECSYGLPRGGSSPFRRLSPLLCRVIFSSTSASFDILLPSSRHRLTTSLPLEESCIQDQAVRHKA